MTTPYTIGSHASGTAVSSYAMSVSTAATGGHQFLVAVSAPSATSAISVTDSELNNYILASQNGTVFIFMTTGITTNLTTSDTITVTFGASSTYAIVAIGCAGILYQTIDVQITGTGTNSPATITSPGTSYWSEIGFALCWNNSASAPSAWGGSYTKISGSANGAGVSAAGYLQWGYQTLSASFNSSGPAPSATIGSVTWKMFSIVMPFQMWTPGSVPSLNPMPAGYVVQPSDMNLMSVASAFLLNKPICRVQDFAGSQSITAEGATVNFTAATMDTDGMWQAITNGGGNFTVPGSNKLTIQTPGFYKIRYGVIDSGVSFNAWVIGTGGPNNPSPGTFASEWGSYSYGVSNIGGAGASGLWPFYLYQGDFLQIWAQYPNSALVTETTDTGSFFSLEWAGY